MNEVTKLFQSLETIAGDTLLTDPHLRYHGDKQINLDHNLQLKKLDNGWALFEGSLCLDDEMSYKEAGIYAMQTWYMYHLAYKYNS